MLWTGIISFVAIRRLSTKSGNDQDQVQQDR
jgi:hypothetical protein